MNWWRKLPTATALEPPPQQKKGSTSTETRAAPWLQREGRGFAGRAPTYSADMTGHCPLCSLSALAADSVGGCCGRGAPGALTPSFSATLSSPGCSGFSALKP